MKTVVKGKVFDLIRPFFVLVMAILFAGFSAAPLFAVDITEIVKEAKVVISNNEGDYSGTMSYKDEDGSLHVAWVNNGDVFYKVRNFDGSWSDTEQLPLGTLKVLGIEENVHLRQAIHFDFDVDGSTQMVMCAENGDLYWISGTPGNWGEPVRIVNKNPFTIYPHILIKDGRYHVVYEDTDIDHLYYIQYNGTNWSEPAFMTYGELPRLASGSGEYVYFYSRGRAAENRNVRFAFKRNASSNWWFNNNVSDTNERLGEFPNLAVYNGKMYMAWPSGLPDSLKSGQEQATVFIAEADEPGQYWNPRVDNRMFVKEFSEDPRPIISAYSDGTIIAANGQRLVERMWLRDVNSGWGRQIIGAPWEDWNTYTGIVPEMINDGRTAYVLGTKDEIALWPLTNPYSSLYNPPLPVISADTTTGFQQLEVQFSSSHPGDVETYYWDFGDGFTSDAANPLHLYTQPGTYTVTLGVSGSWGSSQRTLTDFITVLDTPTEAGFSADVQSGVVPFDVQFTDATLGNITSWHWDFGDGGTATEQHPLHSYTVAGSYTVTLMVDGPSGADTLEKINYIQARNPGPTASFAGTPTVGDAPLTVQFSDQSVGDVTAWQWDFGDGSTSTDQHPQHIYTVPFVYTVTLIASGASGADTLTKQNYINVGYAVPVAEFTADTTHGYAPLTVQFTDQSQGLVTAWSWDFGDGSTSTDQHPQHTYTTTDTFTVTLTVGNPSGTDTEEKTAYIITTIDTDVEETAGRPDGYVLNQNYPNPFNAGTTISYSVPQAGEMTLSVYDMTGRLVKVLKSGSETPGTHRIEWDALSENGHEVPSGMYLVRMSAGKFKAQKKLILIK